MQTRLLTAIALATIILTAAPADARQVSRQTAGQANSGRPALDVAAIPAYPTADQTKAHRLPRRPARGALAAPGPRHPAAEASKAIPAPRQPFSGSGIVRSAKTGATAHVSPRFQPIAQAVVDDLEARGAVIRFMGGYRKGPCWAGGLHPCGLAIDLCQLRRGVVDPRCKLPSKAVEASVAAAHGALSGGIWCNGDRGHIQLGQTAGACGSNLYAAVGEFQARRHRHKIRLAARR